MWNVEKTEEFLKVGVTKNDPATRFAYGETAVQDSDLDFREKIERMLEGEKYISDHPYETELLKYVSYTYEGDARIAERELLETNKSNSHLPKNWFSGAGECFTADEETIQLIENFMDEDSEKRNEAAPSELKYALAAYRVREDDPIKMHEKILEKIEKDS
jgi:hypothetical protein